METLTATLTGLVPFLLHFIPAVVILFAFMWLYSLTTPYDEVALIKANNPAASLTYCGALVGFALPVASALANSINVIDFVVWAVVAAVIQLLVFQIFTRFYPLIVSRVEAGEIAASGKLAAISVAVGLLNAAAMTY